MTQTEIETTDVTADTSLSIQWRLILLTALSVFDLVVTVYVLSHLRILLGPPLPDAPVIAGLIALFSVMYLSLARVFYQTMQSRRSRTRPRDRGHQSQREV